MLKIYIIGCFILLIALISNIIIHQIGIKSWYDFISLIQDEGWHSFQKISVLDFIWLFVVYPFILGLGFLLGENVYRLIC